MKLSNVALYCTLNDFNKGNNIYCHWETKCGNCDLISPGRSLNLKRKYKNIEVPTKIFTSFHHKHSINSQHHMHVHVHVYCTVSNSHENLFFMGRTFFEYIYGPVAAFPVMQQKHQIKTASESQYNLCAIIPFPCPVILQKKSCIYPNISIYLAT